MGPKAIEHEYAPKEAIKLSKAPYYVCLKSKTSVIYTHSDLCEFMQWIDSWKLMSKNIVREKRINKRKN